MRRYGTTQSFARCAIATEVDSAAKTGFWNVVLESVATGTRTGVVKQLSRCISPCGAFFAGYLAPNLHAQTPIYLEPPFR